MAFRPWLLFPAKLAHDLAGFGLDLAAAVTPAVPGEVRSFNWSRKSRSIDFRNPLGTAGGVDKNAEQIWGWHHFGAGFTEVGTVTPRPQAPNPGSIIGRDTSHEALWNRMGFPNAGAHAVRENLREWRRDEQHAERNRFPVFVNLGKQRETPLSEAHGDYTWLIDFFSNPSKDISSQRLSDLFVVNISSPNTKGLRDLFERKTLRAFLAPISERLQFHKTPGLLKLSPDMDDETLSNAVEIALELDLDGFIATNTTAQRFGGPSFPAEGGMSGAPITSLSRDFLKRLIHLVGDRRQGRLIVSAGGVLDGKEAALRLALGADLVQTYSGLVFSGPRFFDRALRQL